MQGADQHIRSSLGFSILPKDSSTWTQGESNQRSSIISNIISIPEPEPLAVIMPNYPNSVNHHILCFNNAQQKKRPVFKIRSSVNGSEKLARLILSLIYVNTLVQSLPRLFLTSLDHSLSCLRLHMSAIYLHSPTITQTLTKLALSKLD